MSYISSNNKVNKIKLLVINNINKKFNYILFIKN